MENGKKKINNGENSGPLTSLPVDRLTATDCNAAARANFGQDRDKTESLGVFFYETETRTYF